VKAVPFFLAIILFAAAGPRQRESVRTFEMAGT
jgi:hypothetical protein